MKNISSLLLIILSFILSCSSDQPEHLHPNVAYSLHSVTDYINIDPDDLPIWEDSYSISFDTLLSFDIYDEKYSIANFAKFRLDRDHFFIAGVEEIYRLDYNGNQLSSLTREGRGPGETVSVSGIVLTDDYIKVMDRINGLLYFDREKLTSVDPPFDSVRAVGVIPEDFCIIDDHFYIQSTFRGRIDNRHEVIFKTDSSFEISQSFFHRYLHDDPTVVHMMSNGLLRCSENHNLMAYSTFLGFHILHIANLDTNQEFAYLFEGFNPLLMDSSDGMDISDKNYGSTYAVFRSNTLIDNRFMLQQYTQTERPSDPDAPFNSEIISFILDLDNDLKMYISRDMPMIIDSFEDMVAIRLRSRNNNEIARFRITEK
ncbi:MAG: hypothetical protein LAT67_10895 [Balneolales bacterium]|nr:hypothetical protein [Balneolales bacterium]